MLLLAFLSVWAFADISVKVYFYRQRQRDYASWRLALRTAANQQCLDCKRLRGHDDDCALDMSVLPPRSDSGGDVR